jgi:hypothetical protein
MPIHQMKRSPLGTKLIAFFFVFGASACALTIVLLLFPGSALDAVWRLNETAHASFQLTTPVFPITLMASIGVACAFAATGLFKGAKWGRRLALVILAVNLIGDTAAAFVRHDPRTLIGIPIGGAMIFYLVKTEKQLNHK